MSRVLVVGGAGSGKSAVAEALLADVPDVTYVATGRVPADAGADADPDWARRVQRHRERRPAGWRTLETTDLVAALGLPGPLLVDALGTWLTAVLDAHGGWTDRPGWRERVAADCAALVTAWSATRGDVVLVADEVGGGVVPATAAGRRFRELLGPLTTRLSVSADRALLVVAGRALELPPPLPALRPAAPQTPIRPAAPGTTHPEDA